MQRSREREIVYVGLVNSSNVLLFLLQQTIGFTLIVVTIMTVMRNILLGEI
jgi:hypothetical protein